MNGPHGPRRIIEVKPEKPRLLRVNGQWFCACWEPFCGGRKSTDRAGQGPTPFWAWSAWYKANRPVPSWKRPVELVEGWLR